MSQKFPVPLAPETLAQAINPWSWWLSGSANQNQNGFINITTYKAKNPKLEQHIISEVAGYGMQLGIVEDMIAMMIAFLPKSQLSAEQKDTIAAFTDMMAEIKTHKDAARLEAFSAGGVDRLVEGLEMLKRDDPALFDRVSARLRTAL